MMRLVKIVFGAVIFCGCALPTFAEGEQEPKAPAEAPVETPPEEKPIADSPEPPVFHIQIWDGHKTNWNEDALADLAAAGFTVLQNGWKGSGFPSRGTLEKVSRHGLLYGAYVDTRYIFREAATEEEKAKVRYAVDEAGKASKSEFNTFDPLYRQVVRRAMEKELKDVEGAAGLYKVMINSEHGSPISYDELTREKATAAGALSAGRKIPSYARGVWRRPKIVDVAATGEPYRFLRWFDSEGGDRAVNRAAAETIRRVRPSVKVTNDPLMDCYTYGQYRGMEILQDWVRVHRAPRDPLSVAYRMERLKAHLRWEAGREGTPATREIWLGPQLGSSSKGIGYAAPADEFEEALWMAAAFGARGITCWGYNTVRRDNALDMDTWGRLKSFRERLLSEYAFLLEANDAPRKCAVLLSKANKVFTTRVYYYVDANYENFYRVLLTAHVPADVVYDEDVLAGGLSKYKALFLPGIEHLTPELEAAITAFEKKGGRVVKWPVLLPRYVDYEITKGNAKEDTDPANPRGAYLYPHQYRKWRHIQAAKLFKTVEDLMDVTVDNPDIVMNVVDANGKRYVVLVNDSRTYGAWTTERGHRWCEDDGLAAKATVTLGRGEEARTVEVKVSPASLSVIPF